jgi:hypothetical protein
VLFAIAIMASGLALIGELWHTSLLREKEADLLHIGNAYRRAIMLYYESTPMRQYPRQLEYLVKDNRFPATRRYLRKLYPDPITGGEWGTMRGPDGGIMGVYSVAPGTPLKSANFRLVNTGFAGASRYADLKFLYQPTPVVAPAAASGTPAPR